MANKPYRRYAAPRREIDPQQAIDRMGNVVNGATSGKIDPETAAQQLAQMTMSLVKSAQSVNIRNRRVKRVFTPPQGMDAKEFNTLLDEGVYNNERAARALSYDLGAREYTYRNIIKTYQDVLTYRDYVQPCYDEIPHEAKKREMLLLDKARRAFRARETLHAVVGRAGFEGKGFYYHDYEFDKAHNKCLKNRIVELPSDYCTIVGANPVSKYTVAFNMMYLCENPELLAEPIFGDYADAFVQIFMGDSPAKEVYRKVYGIEAGAVPSSVHIPYFHGGAFWIVLPTDRTWTFEIDDTTRAAIPIFTGLFRAILKLTPAEDIFLDLIQNPLTSVLTGEIPYFKEGNGAQTQDKFAMSAKWNDYFTDAWRDALVSLNAPGVGIFAAPYDNMKLHQLSDAPNAEKLLPAVQKYALGKSGLHGIIPATDSVLAGQISVSKRMAAAFAEPIYRTAERMMDTMIQNLNLKGEYQYKMFGNVFDDGDEIKALEKSLTLGVLPNLFRYNALHDRSVMDDMSMSKFIFDFDLMRYRIPHFSSYNGSSDKAAPVDPSPGRPKTDRDNLESDETEHTIDKLMALLEERGDV